MILTKLHEKGLIAPPKFLLANTAFLVRMGSEAYGASLGGTASDIDVVGFAIPRKEDVFPYSVGGHILGFGASPQPFQQWSMHHVKDGDKEYDLTVFSIVKLFNLAMDNNPNALETLFVPDRCIIHATDIGKMVRDNRKLFLHKGAMHKLRGYAFSQMRKIADKVGSSNEKRRDTIDTHGFDTKHAYHVARLCLQAEQVLEEHDLTLDRNSQMLLSIRRGEWTLEQLQTWFHKKEQSLEESYGRSTLRHSPDEDAIRALLLRCLEAHYGSLHNAVTEITDAKKILNEIRAVIDRFDR